MNLYPHAIIFAGGKSTRMGTDKALLPFAQYNSLSEYQYKKLENMFEYVSISAKKNKFDFQCHVITDNYEASSPLVGILSVFETLPDVQSVFILSVDAPFIEHAVIQRIMERESPQADIIVAKSPSGIQPLCGLYKRSVLSLAQAQYKKGKHKLQDLLALAQTEVVLFDEDGSFTNINHPEEYDDALKRS